MARIFLSYNHLDRTKARAVEKGLAEKGHQSVWGVDELIAGKGWGELMPTRLASADALVALLTPNSKDASTVWCEVGAARALANGPKRLALLPVILGLPGSAVRTRHPRPLGTEDGGRQPGSSHLGDRPRHRSAPHGAQERSRARRVAEDLHQSSTQGPGDRPRAH